MSMEEKAIFASNGIKCQVAMILRTENQEQRETLDALVMSLPLATALAITEISVFIDARHDGEIAAMRVKIAPEALAVQQMLDKILEMLQTGFEVFFGGTPENLVLLAAEPADAEPKAPALEGMSVPGRRIVLLDGEETA